MIQVSEELMDAVDQTTVFLPRLAAAATVLVVLLFLGRMLGNGVARILVRRGSGRLGSIARSVVQWTLGVFGTVIALQILGLSGVAGSLLATGGLMAVILGFAFRSIGENLLAGVFLGFSRAFEVGDVIESSGHTGTVRDINLRSVHIRTADGRDIFIPCTQIFANPLVNLTRDGIRRADFVLGVDYRHDPGEVHAVLLRTVQNARGVLAEPAPAVLISEFHANYQEFRILFWVDVRGEMGLGQVRSRLMRACLNAVKEAGFVLSADVSTAVTLDPVKVDMARSGSSEGGQ